MQANNIITNSKVKIAVVDDHNLFRKGLIKLINLGDADGKYAVLFEAENGLDLIKKLNQQNLPDIILIDIDMPYMDGYETVAWLIKHQPGIRLLIMSMLESLKSVEKMLSLGVQGYLSKDIEIEDMHNALQAITNNGYFYSKFISEILMKKMRGDNTNKSSNTSDVLKPLSDKERRFLQLACTELTYSQIADKMFMSPKTIDGYREALFFRFNVKSRVSLAMYAIKHGIVNL